MADAPDDLDRHRQALRELTGPLSRSDRRFEETVDRVLELGCSYLDLDIGFLSAIDTDQRTFEVRHARGDHPALQAGESADLEVTYCRRTLEAEGLLAVEAVDGDWQGDPAEERFGLACYLGGTVTVDGEVYGTLCFASRERRDRSFSADERAFVELVVEWLGESLERHTSEQALATERAFVDEVLSTVDDTVFVVDTQGRLQRWNDEVRAVTGYDDETLSGMDVRTLFDDATVDGIETAIAAALEDGEVTLEAEVVTATGERVPMEFRASLLRDETGTVVGICGVGRDVTERRARERRLEQYERAMENVRGLVYVLDGEDRITIATPRLAERLGYEEGALLGQPIADIVADPTVATERTDADEDTVAETTLLAADGREIPVRIDVTPLDTEGVVGTIRDVTELAAARRELDDERSRFQYLFDTIQDPLGEVRFEDGEPILQAVNEAFEDVFGHDAADIVGRSTNDIIVPPDAETEAHAVDERVLRQGSATVEIRRETASGLRDFLFRGIPYGDGDDVRAFGIYTDITEQKRRERYLKVLGRVVRHNLRNKLDVILGNAEWLDADMDGDHHRRVELILDAATELESLSATAQQIERLLEMDRPRAATVDAARVAADVTTEARERWPATTVSIETPDSVPVQADERLAVALSELIENAVEHGPEDVSVAITVNSGGADGWATIAVADDGPGIPETERGVLTGETEITQLTHSRGLGLWLVTWIVESFGGDLTITTSEAGSVVTVKLKRVEESA